MLLSINSLNFQGCRYPVCCVVGCVLLMQHRTGPWWTMGGLRQEGTTRFNVASYVAVHLECVVVMAALRSSLVSTLVPLPSVHIRDKQALIAEATIVQLPHVIS